MATLYLMNLEERVDLARSQLDLVILRLRSIKGHGRSEDIERAAESAASQLEHISELIAR